MDFTFWSGEELPCWRLRRWRMAVCFSASEWFQQSPFPKGCSWWTCLWTQHEASVPFVMLWAQPAQNASAAWGRYPALQSFMLPKPLKHQMPHRLSMLLLGTSPTNTTLAQVLVCFILCMFLKSQGGMNSLYWSHQFDTEGGSATFFPNFRREKVLIRLSFILNSCRMDSQIQLPGI